MTATDGPALLRAIIAHPDEDTLRLVYADWLDENAGMVPCKRCKGAGRERNPDYDELQPCGSCYASGTVPNGNAERAESIRVQVEIARMQSDGDPGCDCAGKRNDPAHHCRQTLYVNRLLKLQDRGQELLGSHWSVWSAPHPGPVALR